jgi:hypothetical protein
VYGNVVIAGREKELSVAGAHRSRAQNSGVSSRLRLSAGTSFAGALRLERIR